MSKRVETGHIRGIIVHQGARHYSVSLDDGSTVLINEHQILPLPETRLPRGTQLTLEYKTPTVIVARLQPNRSRSAPSPSHVSSRPTLAPEAPSTSRDLAPPGIVDGSVIAEPSSTWEPSPRPSEDAKSADTALDAPIDCPEVEPLFTPGGPVSKLLGRRYRPRPGQIQMANLVRDALRLRQHAFVEAGTGIGKSFAYLVPVIW